MRLSKEDKKGDKKRNETDKTNRIQDLPKHIQTKIHKL